MTTQEKINKAVMEARRFPNAKIEHNFEFYKDATDFNGVKAVYNESIKNPDGYQVTYTY